MRILLTLLFTLILGTSYAQQNERIFALDDFSKGLNQHISEFKTPNNQAHDCYNVRFNEKYGSLSKRDSLLAEVDLGTGAVKGLYKLYKTDGTAITVGAIGTTLKADVNGTAVIIKDNLTDGAHWQFLTYQDNVMGFSKSDPPIKWDGNVNTTANVTGARSVNVSCGDLGAPLAQLNNGTALNASSWYQYKIAYYDGTTYHYSSAKSNPLLTGADVYDIKLTDIPLGETGTTYRYIYRTLGRASRATVEADTTYFLVKNITNNTGVTWNDTVADATADDNSTPTWATVSAGINVTPPMGYIPEIHRESLFISGNTTYPSDVFWSVQYKPDWFTPTDFIQVRPDDGDEITFLKSFLDNLVIGKTNTIQKLYTEAAADANWSMSNPFSFIGCPAPFTPSATPMGIAYLGRRGLYLFNGGSSQLISDAVTPQINDISQTNIEECAGYYLNNEYRLAYTSAESGGTVNNRVLVYDFTRDAYTLDLENVSCFAGFSSGTDFGVLYSGSSTQDGYVFAHTQSPTYLSQRYKSEIDAGTFDDLRTAGTEANFTMEIAWDCTINSTGDDWLTELQTKNSSIATIDDIETYLPLATIARPDANGTWTSDYYDIKAANLSKLYWNERLGAYGDITFAVRGADATLDCMNATWNSTVTDPSGSDLSTIPAYRYIQVRANFTTTNSSYSPTLYLSDNYVWRIGYSKVGAAYESSMLSKYETGWKDFGGAGYPKIINYIKVYYQGEEGNITVNYKNIEGDWDKDFIIDLSINPLITPTEYYTVQGDNKVYTHYTPINNITGKSPVGKNWKFTFSDLGITDWTIDKAEIQFSVEPIYD